MYFHILQVATKLSLVKKYTYYQLSMCLCAHTYIYVFIYIYVYIIQNSMGTVLTKLLPGLERQNWWQSHFEEWESGVSQVFLMTV